LFEAYFLFRNANVLHVKAALPPAAERSVSSE
jgi:hypothetical protein